MAITYKLSSKKLTICLYDRGSLADEVRIDLYDLAAFLEPHLAKLKRDGQYIGESNATKVT